MVGGGGARPKNALKIGFCPGHRNQDANSLLMSKRSGLGGWPFFGSRRGSFIKED